ncbi:MAG: HEAT repeat domain-containing protein [Anaerolineae bacterium]|nr:HEAT repeat domain-containing protein [Anaerolineae bacterium]
MLWAGLLQRGGWHFDLLSAIIGAIIAWIIAGMIYVRRAGLIALKEKLIAQITRLSDRFQSSQEEKYLQVVQEALKRLLLFTPQDPQAIFQPPHFETIWPHTYITTPEGLQKPLHIPFNTLLAGHSRLLIVGSLGSGRTMSLAMLVWQVAEGAKPFTHFPLWIDLAYFKMLPEGNFTAQERLLQLAMFFLPNVTLKWLAKQLKRWPSLMLLDNWDALGTGERGLIRAWINETAQNLPESIWVIVSTEEGYGPLVEAGFVPLKLIPATGEEILADLFAGWTKLKAWSGTGLSSGRGKDQPDQMPGPPEEILDVLRWATLAGASLMELNVRIMLYLQTQQFEVHPVETMDRFLDTRVPTLALGEGQQEVAEQARMLTLATFSHIAYSQRMEGRTLSREQVFEFVTTLLPPEEERPAKLEGAIRKLLNEAQLLQHGRGGQEKSLILTHYLWTEFLTAWSLAGEEQGVTFIQEHLDDPAWTLLIEFYMGIGDVASLIQGMLKKAMSSGNDVLLLRIARWCLVVPEDPPWRKWVIQTLAQRFKETDVEAAIRLRLGRDLALLAGEGARAFYLQMLRHSSPLVRSTALRGLGWVGVPQDIDILNKALQDEHTEMRRNAVQALADLGTAGAITLLEQTLSHTDEELMLHITETLALLAKKRGTEAALNVLRNATEHTDLLVRRAACYGLEHIDHLWADEKLEYIAREDPEWLVRSAADTILKAKQTARSAKVLVPAPPRVEQMAWLITWAAGQGTGLGVGQAAWDMLVQAVKEGPPDIQIRGIELIASIGQKQDADKLRALRFEAHDPEILSAVEDAIQSIEQRYSFHQGNHTLEI